MYVSVEFGFLLKIGKHKACSKPLLETLHEKSRLMSANPSLGFCDSTSWIPHSCSMVGGFSTDTLSVGNNEMDYMENSSPGCPKEGQVPSPSCLTVGKSSLLDHCPVDKFTIRKTNNCNHWLVITYLSGLGCSDVE